MPTSRRAATLVFALAGLLIMAGHVAVSLSGGSDLARGVLFCAGTSAAVAGILAGLRVNRPAFPLPWILIGAGALVSSVGDLMVTVPGPVLTDWSNAAYLARFPLIATGLILLIRRRTPGRDTPALLDATVVAVATSLVSWVFVIQPAADAAARPMLALLSTAYPAGDLLLFILGAGLMLGRARNPGSLRLLGGYLVLFCWADSSYTVRVLDGRYDYGPLLELAFVAASVLLGLAALHPSMTTLADPIPVGLPDASIHRLVVLAFASLLAPATLVVQYLRGAELHVLLIAGACALLFLLVVTRLGGLLHAHRQAAITDALTGLYTRRFLTESLTAEHARAARTGEPLSLVLLDIDHFKRVNDTYGHTAGDHVLAEVSARLRDNVRAGDVVARYGGEEFAVLLPRTGRADAHRVAERLRAVVAAVEVPVGGAGTIPVTVSVGVAAQPDPTAPLEDLVLATDRLLYRSKENGRNRVTAASLPALVQAGPGGGNCRT